MYKEQKPMLSTADQIAHLESKSIKFELISKEEAKDYLDKNNNYFKLCAFRKNFPKHPSGEREGQYIDLDFAMLKDLAIIDMRLRYVFIHMCLDIEHFSKVKLLTTIQAHGEDGYTIVEDYMSSLKSEDEVRGTSKCDILTAAIMRNADNPYCGSLVNKYQGELPVWVFVEIIPFGSLIHFYGFCADRFNSKAMKDEFYLLKDTKELRNAAAHSNCIINDLSAKNSVRKLSYVVARAIPTNVITKSTRIAKNENERIRQITTLLYAHSHIVTSVGVLSHQKETLKGVVERMDAHREYYTGNDSISSNFDYFNNLVDIFYH